MAEIYLKHDFHQKKEHTRTFARWHPSAILAGKSESSKLTQTSA